MFDAVLNVSYAVTFFVSVLDSNFSAAADFQSKVSAVIGGSTIERASNVNFVFFGVVGDNVVAVVFDVIKNISTVAAIESVVFLIGAAVESVVAVAAND